MASMVKFDLRTYGSIWLSVGFLVFRLTKRFYD